MVQKAENPYDICFGPYGEYLVPPHLFSFTDYLEMARFLENTPSVILSEFLTSLYCNPSAIRDKVLQTLKYYAQRYAQLPIPEDPEDLANFDNFCTIADCVLRRAVVLYEPLEEALAFIGTEDDYAILWRLQKGK